MLLGRGGGGVLPLMEIFYLFPRLVGDSIVRYSWLETQVYLLGEWGV